MLFRSPEGAEWGVTYTDHEAWEKNRKAWEEHRNVLPSACHVGCPIVAMAHGYQQKTAVPCVRGRQSQAHAYGWRDDSEKLALLSDPQDPVNVQGLRPCVMLGKMLRVDINRDDFADAGGEQGKRQESCSAHPSV